MSWLSELWKRITGKGSKRDTSDYYDAATAGPGYPGRSEIRVYLNKEPIRPPAPSSLSFPSRWEICRDALEIYRPIFAECGKTIVFVDSPVGADCVLPVWSIMPEGKAAFTDGLGNVSIDTNRYDESDAWLAGVTAHEMLHVLGVGTHSTNPADVGHSKSRSLRLTERDKNTIRRTLKP